MGIDWCWMRPKTEYLDEIRYHIEQQSIAWNQWEQTLGYERYRSVARHGGWEYLEDLPYCQHILGLGESIDDAKVNYQISSGRLRELLEIPAFTHEARYQIRRVSSGNGSYIPIEWKIDNYRTFLPEDLPELFDRFTRYLDALKAGSHQDYLFHYYLYDASHKAYATWHYLRYVWSSMASNRPNAWALRMRDTNLDKQAKSLEPPEIYPHVLWANWLNKLSSDIDFETDSRYQRLHTYMKDIYDFKRAIHKTKGKYTSIGAYYKVEVFEKPDEPFFKYTGEFLEWLRTCIDNNMGLFFWY